MNLIRWVNQAKDLSFSALSQASDALGAGVGFVRSAVGKTWLFGSTESSSSVLAQLDRALETSEGEYEPILEFDAGKLTFGARDRDRLFKLTCQAVANTYEDAIENRSSWQQAQLGPEDIRYLNLLTGLAKDDEP